MDYDALNRIIGAIDNTGNYNVSNITYDKMGNIKTLTRNGWQDGSFPNMDILGYEYDGGNKLLKVADTGNAAYGFIDRADQTVEFTYDPNGNLTSDANKGITDIDYNHLNLPTQVTFASGNIKYDYAADGTKLKKTVSTTGAETLYANGYVYQGNTLQFFGTPEGYVTPEANGWRYVYQYRDHLDNIRLSYTEDPSNPGQPTIIEENNFYPFGGRHKGYNMGGDNALGNDLAQKWKFGGKELDESLGLETYDFGARNYDPWIGRWMNIDPLAEQMRRLSPYNFAFNNPIIFQDPDGMAPFTDLFDKNGKKVGADGVDNGVKVVVTDDAKADEISKIEGNVNLDEVGLSANNAVVLPDDATLQESLNVLDRQVANGGRREEASTVVENGRRINRAETGSEPTITKQEDGTYTATAETNLPETPLLPGEEITATIHSHPTEAIEQGGQVFPFSANTPTAGSDTEAFKSVRTNIIVGPTSGNVTRGSDGKLIDSRTKGVSIFNNKSQLQISLPAKTVKKIIGN